MLNAKPSSPGFLIVTLTVGILATFAMPMRGQDPQTITIGNVRLTGLPEDWTHRRGDFYRSGDRRSDAMRNGKYDEWFGIVSAPRYLMQQMKRGEPARGPFADDVNRYHEVREAARRDEKEKHGRERDDWNWWDKDRKKSSESAINGDWSMDIGVGAKVGIGQFPAKFRIQHDSRWNVRSYADNS